MIRFNETSLDPYVRFFEPRLSPFTNAVAGGTIRVVGELADPHHIVVEGRVEQLDLKLFDYRLRNEGPIELTLDRGVVPRRSPETVGRGDRTPGHGSRRARPERSAGRGVRRREPRDPAGLLP